MKEKGFLLYMDRGVHHGLLDAYQEAEEIRKKWFLFSVSFGFLSFQKLTACQFLGHEVYPKGEKDL